MVDIGLKEAAVNDCIIRENAVEIRPESLLGQRFIGLDSFIVAGLYGTDFRFWSPSILSFLSWLLLLLSFCSLTSSADFSCVFMEESLDLRLGLVDVNRVLTEGSLDLRRGLVWLLGRGCKDSGSIFEEATS